MIILLALWIGLLAGFAEVVILELKLHLFGQFLILSRHLVWMVPMVDAVIFLLLGCLLALAHRWFPRIVTVPRALGALVFSAVMALLIPFPQIHHAAAALLALGIAVQASRLATPRLSSVAYFAKKSTVLILVVVVVMAVGFITRDRLGGRLTTSRLPAAEAGAPNVLLIILDTVRGMNMSLYGYPRPTTPEIDRWARGGAVFDHAFAAAPWTLPSHAVMFTGRQVYDLSAGWETPLDRWPLTLAEALARRGYATAGFVANVRYTGTETGLARGFAHYEDYRIDVGEAVKSTALTEAFHSTYNRKLHLPPIRPRTPATEVSARFTRWLDRRDPARPFFVFLNYLDAHAPYLPAEPFRSRFETQPGARLPNVSDARPNKVQHPVTRFTPADARPSMDLYDGAVAELDAHIGQLLKDLSARGLLENTIIVLTSDHGEAFAEHGMLGHANNLYRPALEVPLVISYPGHVPSGVRVSIPVSLRDLAATIADLAYRGGSEFPGISLQGYWNGTRSGQDSSIAAQIRQVTNQPEWWPASRGDMMSLVAGGWHYIVNEGTGREELFELETDRTEQHDLALTPAGERELPGLRSALRQLRSREPDRRQ